MFTHENNFVWKFSAFVLHIMCDCGYWHAGCEVNDSVSVACLFVHCSSFVIVVIVIYVLKLLEKKTDKWIEEKPNANVLMWHSHKKIDTILLTVYECIT